MDVAGPSHVLVITGSMGAGKTAVLGEASDLLSSARIPHAAVDLDALGVYHALEPLASETALTNLAAIWNTYASAGITRLLLAEAIESVSQREALRDTLKRGQLTVCRLGAPVEIMQRRVRARETGVLRDQYTARVAVLERLLDAAAVEDFTVANDGRPITDVAREVLARASWLA